MKNLDQLELILEVVFRCCSAREVLEHCNDQSPGIRDKDYEKLAFDYISNKRNEMLGQENRFSKEDLRNQFRYFRQKVHEWRMEMGYPGCDEDWLNPVDCLFFYVNRVLHREDNELVCRYERLLNWRSLTNSISVDLPVAAWLAMNTAPRDLAARDLNWRLVLDHDNFQLQRIMARGTAENHFHLYGSAPIFQLAWVSLMNQLCNSTTIERLRVYERNRKNPETRGDTTRSEPTFPVQHLLAATIRMILFTEVNRLAVKYWDPGYVYYDFILNALVGRENPPHEQEDLPSPRLRMLIKRVQTIAGEDDPPELELDAWRGNLQSTIDTLRDWNGASLPDYALLGCPQDWGRDDDNLFLGERWLLFQCLYLIYHELMDEVYANLFFAYLILKLRLRRELIQLDNRVGFSNFRDYERRKFDLIGDSVLNGKTGAATRAAVRAALLENRNVESLEIRVSPWESAKNNARMIRRLDGILGVDWVKWEQNGREGEPPGPWQRFYYVFHFLKREDNWHKDDETALYCRHYLFRHRLKRQTAAIQTLRERCHRLAERVLGIDAAAAEIVCRPEVFGPCFRFLHEHKAKWEESDGNYYLPQLRRTYHVGEDFLDVADGLRAIEEAIRFLNLESGDRLGHALALGIDVEAWYAAKNNVITLPLQDHLDNVAWLYHQLLKYPVSDPEDAKEHLRQEFNDWFSKLYQKNMEPDLIEHFLRLYHQDPHIPPEYRWNLFDSAGPSGSCQSMGQGGSNGGIGQYHFDIFQYYNAWKLRGDDPELYSDGYYHVDRNAFTTDYDRCRTNRHDFIDQGIRYDPGVFLIHYFYHYSKSIREEGEKQIQIEVPQFYVDAVAQVQRFMQREIGRMGLAIECNPSSNVSIGTFKRFDRHPILRFYNRNLEVDSTLLEANPQLLVSINTDDQGVFSTSLENEFALMACALEKAEFPDGSKRYPRQRVYAWLDDVRKMGLEQPFSKRSASRKWPNRRFRITDVRRGRG